MLLVTASTVVDSEVLAELQSLQVSLDAGVVEASTGVLEVVDASTGLLVELVSSTDVELLQSSHEKLEVVDEVVAASTLELDTGVVLIITALEEEEDAASTELEVPQADELITAPVLELVVAASTDELETGAAVELAASTEELLDHSSQVTLSY